MTHICTGGMSERQCLEWLEERMNKNSGHEFTHMIGMGYNNTVTPAVILRNVLENPRWYTPYTPYQAEIAQGRLESLLNFQTMVSDLVGLPLANASLLDEGTAAAEAMVLAFNVDRKKRSTYLVSTNVHPQTRACLEMRAEPFGIHLRFSSPNEMTENLDDVFGAMLQYPDTYGRIEDYEAVANAIHDVGGRVVAATDLLASTLIKPAGEWGADVAIGSSQRFGVPLGFGGPHAAFMAVREDLKRNMAGRLIGISRDAQGNRALRMALQAREQHIRREKASSNVCTAQALLANVAAMYGVYHGPDGLKDIALRVHTAARIFADAVTGDDSPSGVALTSPGVPFFDTVTLDVIGDGGAAGLVHRLESEYKINIRHVDSDTVSVSFDETTTADTVRDLIEAFGGDVEKSKAEAEQIQKRVVAEFDLDNVRGIRHEFARTSDFMTAEVFNKYHSETEMTRYITALSEKDLTLTETMIPLGSCTMKLNATTEMIPVTWASVNNIHPFAPAEQTRGYAELFADLERDLATLTGFDAVSLQPNSGSQGEYAGLRAISAYHANRGEAHRNVCLIPISAHGTNGASATMVGMKVVVVKADDHGYIDMDDLKSKVELHRSNLAAFMVTYPSTYGIYEPTICEAIDLIHEAGGQVYLDGANMNAQVGICTPGGVGADVCHLNLHKTFCIPHGGGGPGMGPIGVKSHLADFLPGHPVVPLPRRSSLGPVSAAPYGSASILPITVAYLAMMGMDGLRMATQVAILNANYMAKRLSSVFNVKFKSKESGMVGHEFIVDFRKFKESAGVEVIDIAKRLQDYGLHAPTMSWPVQNAMMIEPTESESLDELDRLIEALIQIREEIRDIEEGRQPRDNNLLKNAPHTLAVVTADEWNHPYSREAAAWPMKHLYKRKFWPTVGRIDDAYGDRNLQCSCEPMESYNE